MELGRIIYTWENHLARVCGPFQYINIQGTYHYGHLVGSHKVEDDEVSNEGSNSLFKV